MLCKVDIEGAEIDLFKHLRKAKPTKHGGPPMCLVDRFWVEFHSWMYEEGSAAKQIKSFEDSFEEKVARWCKTSKHQPRFKAWY